MKFLVKYFAEITIKSKPVRRHFVAQLHENLRFVLREIDPGIEIHRGWDKLEVLSGGDAALSGRLVEAMRRVPGIASILEVVDCPLPPLEEIVDAVLPVYAAQLEGRTFAVRCKRNGVHPFTSMDVDRTVGAALLARTGAAYTSPSGVL